jgi:hypothetical protein
MQIPCPEAVPPATKRLTCVALTCCPVARKPAHAELDRLAPWPVAGRPTWSRAFPQHSRERGRRAHLLEHLKQAGARGEPTGRIAATAH